MIEARSVASALALCVLVGGALGGPAAAQTDEPSNWMRDFVTSRVAAQNLRAIGTEGQAVSGEEIMSLIRPRIVGGSVASATDNPFQVALLMASQPSNASAQFCGGTLVRPNMVVTAAHCSDFVTAPQVQVLTGARLLDGSGDRRNVTRITIHPSWNSSTFDNDVAVWELATEAVGAPLATLATEDGPVGGNLLVTGWGTLTEGGTSPIDLRRVLVPLVDIGTCNDANSYNGQILPSMICAGLDAGGRDSCQGDLGGPLTRGPDNGILTGIVSWGSGCARPNLFGVYTHVSNPTIRNFIEGEIGTSGPSWGGWEFLDGTIMEAPDCVSWSVNRIDCFARGTDNAMWHRWWDGASWGGWESLGGVIMDAPDCVSWGTNRIDCFARGTDNAMWHRWWDGAAWGGWESLGGVILGAPDCTSWGPNRLDCFAKGTDNAMYHRWWDGVAWGGWESLGGTILETPDCVSWGPNRIDCFARGTDAAMWHRWWDGAAWGGWESLGGTIIDKPDCVAWGPNRLDCFARGTDLAMWHRWWDGAGWGGWESLGGTIIEKPACTSWGSNWLDCFARGTDNAMWHRWWDGTAWGGWEGLGGIILSGPNCVAWGSNRLDCFAPGTDNALYHRWWG